MSKKTGIFFAGLLVGAATGAITGLLLAPRSGKKTRQMLKKSVEALPELAEDLSANLQYQADRLSESSNISALTALTRNMAWEETLDRLKTAIIMGIEASQTEKGDDLSTTEETIEDNDHLSKSVQEK